MLYYWVPARPGSCAARVVCVASLPVVIVLAVTGIVQIRHGGAERNVFLSVWLVVLACICAANYRTLFLGVGRRAELMKAAYDSRHSA